MTHRKKLIEVALPLEAINKEAAREKSIRHGHPSTLHLWWARRPLAAARAVIFAQMVDDPSSLPDLFPTEAKQEKERERLFRIIEELVKWENTTNEAVLERARTEIWQSWRRACAENADHPRAKDLFDRHKLPGFHDPFAGGGALPLEAQRLGLEAYASDLNPVAVLINKAMIEIPPRFAGKPPVNPEARAKYLGTRASRPQHATETIALPGNTHPHKEWHSRGYLPHFDHPGMVQSITFRLADSVPAELVDRWRAELRLVGGEAADDPRCAELRERIEKYADEGKGACWLRQPKVASMVENALLHFDGERYRLLAWCVMPNHVHALIETMPGFPLGDVVHSWKSFTAKECNRTLERQGEFWMPDYFDRFIRDAKHMRAVVEYIANNPVKAGLCGKPEDWRWSHLGIHSLGTRASCPQNNADGTSAFPGDADGTSAFPGGADGTSALPGLWKGAQGLAEDVRHYGQWMRDEAEKRIGKLYPPIEVTPEMAKGRPDLKPYVGRKLTVIAWLWARTVKSPNPAFATVDVPLASTFMLSTKAGKEAYVEPVILGASLGARASGPHAGETPAVPGYRFTVKVGKPKDAERAKNGTSAGKRAAFKCLMSGTPIPYDYIRNEGQAGQMGTRLMAIVAEGDRGRVYLAPTSEHEAAARKAKPEWKPETPLHGKCRVNVSNYGLDAYGDLFTPRQLVALTTFSDLVGEAMQQVHRDALAAGLPADNKPLRDGGTGATAYAEAVGVYLAFVVSRLVDFNSTVCGWIPVVQATRNTFARQAIPMTWDYAELNVFGNWLMNYGAALEKIIKPQEIAFPATHAGSAAARALQSDGRIQSVSRERVVSTDPPYYDNIGYADLSDFFYVWLRRSLRPVFPDLFATLAVPKAEELVATPYRHGSKEQAETFFLDGMTQAMHRLAEQAHPAFPVTIYYAFKQSETLGARAFGPPNADETSAHPGTASTGWETFLDAVIRAGFSISGTWPMRTEGAGRMIAKDTNALASSIVLVCRRRPSDAATTTRKDFLAALRRELPPALRHLQRGNIAPVDLAQASIGPGMAVFSRYSRILETDGKPMTMRTALQLINQTLDETLAEQEGDFDPETAWAVAWFEQFAFNDGPFGDAETLSKAKNTALNALIDAGIVGAGAGKVRLVKPGSAAVSAAPGSAGVPPASFQKHPTIWLFTHLLIHALETGGETAAAELLTTAGGTPALPGEDVARELAYRLYSICERRKRAAEALAYNTLVQSWPEIARLARDAAATSKAPEQGELL